MAILCIYMYVDYAHGFDIHNNYWLWYNCIPITNASTHCIYIYSVYNKKKLQGIVMGAFYPTICNIIIHNGASLLQNKETHSDIPNYFCTDANLTLLCSSSKSLFYVLHN